MPGNDSVSVLAPGRWEHPLGELSYQVFARGGDREPVLLLHAVGGSSALWQQVVPLIVDRRTVVVPDLLGHGDSGNPIRQLTISDHAEMIADLLSKLSIARCAVAGCSMGALIALELAAQYPTRVSTLICNGCPGWHLESQRMARFKMMAARAGPDGKPDPDSLGGTAKPSSVAIVARRRKDLIRCGEWFFSSWWAIAAFDPITRLHRITCPVRIIMGEQDFHLPTAYALVEGLREARLQILPGVGHLSPFDDPAAIADAINDVAP